MPDIFSFLSVASAVTLVLMVLACVEVGSNDAANLVNAVFGARIMSRKRAVMVAGLFVILGAVCASPVMNTVRKGIFDLALFDAQGAVAVFIAAYLINTILLFVYSAYGLPVSTTATLVFSLAGGALGVSLNMEAVHWLVVGKVMVAILISILLSGFFGLILQRCLRSVISDDDTDHDIIMRHGPWVAALLLTSLVWFMVAKGMKGFAFVAQFQDSIDHWSKGIGLFVGLLLFVSLVIRFALLMLGEKVSAHLFQFTAVVGMACMAFAFGQNDLANCASPGLAIWMIVQGGVAAASETSVSFWALLGCGLLMSIGMTTSRAQRVTRSEVNMASQQNKVKLYAPVWTIVLARGILSLATGKRYQPQQDGQSQPKVEIKIKRTKSGKKIHYDALRASIILAVSASVIAFASSLGLPVSTTYVCFAAVLATGWGDRVFSQGRSDLKVGRAIWVMTSWGMAAILAAMGCFIFAWLINNYTYMGLGAVVLINLGLRHFFKTYADRHEVQHHLKNGGKGRSKKRSLQGRDSNVVATKSAH